MQAYLDRMKKKKPIFIRIAAVLAPVILLLLLSQTVFAQNTYMIKDGDRVVYHTSFATDPATILTEAGLALGADDTYTTVAGVGVSEINVQRGRTVTVNNCGEIIGVVTRGETVEALLTRLGIAFNASTELSAPLHAMTYDGMVLTISRTIRTEEVYTTTIPHEVIYCNDATIPEGQSVVLTKGIDGQLACTASVVYVDGVETGRTVVDQTVIQQPVSEVIAIGTGSAVPEQEDSYGELVIGDGYIITETGERLNFIDAIKVQATAYTHTDEGCNEVTATGTIVHVGTVAVDPRMIPYGTRMFIISDDGKFVYGVATAEDCGGAIKQNRIDLYYPTTEECLAFGRRNCTVYILGEANLIR